MSGVGVGVGVGGKVDPGFSAILQAVTEITIQIVRINIIPCRMALDPFITNLLSLFT
jgi:hypothetical protein